MYLSSAIQLSIKRQWIEITPVQRQPFYRSVTSLIDKCASWSSCGSVILRCIYDAGSYFANITLKNRVSNIVWLAIGSICCLIIYTKMNISIQCLQRNILARNFCVFFCFFLMFKSWCCSLQIVKQLLEIWLTFEGQLRSPMSVAIFSNWIWKFPSAMSLNRKLWTRASIFTFNTGHQFVRGLGPDSWTCKHWG